MGNKTGWKAIENRIQELVEECKGIPAHQIMGFLKKAEKGSETDVEKMISELRRKIKKSG